VRSSLPEPFTAQAHKQASQDLYDGALWAALRGWRQAALPSDWASSATPADCRDFVQELPGAWTTMWAQHTSAWGDKMQHASKHSGARGQ